jgi:hypothetical protein
MERHHGKRALEGAQELRNTLLCLVPFTFLKSFLISAVGSFKASHRYAILWPKDISIAIYNLLPNSQLGSQLSSQC